MDYEIYKAARDTAWRTLIRFGVSELPVKVSALVKQSGYRLFSYEKGEDVLRKLGCLQQAKICDGFTVLSGGQYFIFYDGSQIPTRIRFTLAHELGHIEMGHLREGRPTPRNREPSEDDAPEEQGANVFASRLLLRLACCMRFR